MRRWWGTVLVVLAMAPAAAAQERAVYTVSPSGDDGNPGTAEQPWRTISKAASTVPPGSLVDVRGGTYNERVVVEVSGAPGRPTTFQAHPGEPVTISGAGLKGRFEVGLIQIANQSHLEFVGFELTGLRDGSRGGRFVPSGVWIFGRASNITLRGLDIHDIRTRRGDAHGIAVYGSTRTAIRDIAIEGNHVHDLKLGSSEAVAVNGNVDGWRVVGNLVENTDNIGIDAIGYEGTAPRNDRARNGLIAGNVVREVDTRRNFAYEPECRCAGGIYVDGGRDITIEGNHVTKSNLGIELASEARRGATSDILMRNNVVTLSDHAGLTMGGYDRRRGTTERVVVLNNTFVDNDQLRNGFGELVINYRLLDSRIVNNVFLAGGDILATNPFRANRDNVFDGNVWFTPGEPSWQWRTRQIGSFAAWQDATGGEAGGQFADPLVGADGRPQPGSPLIDRGVPAPAAGVTDIAGSPRVQGAGIDVGAFEAG